MLKICHEYFIEKVKVAQVWFGLIGREPIEAFAYQKINGAIVCSCEVITWQSIVLMIVTHAGIFPCHKNLIPR